MRAIIVDDEIDAINTLRSILKLFDQGVEIVDLARSAKEAIQKINLHKPELVFLDIEMPNGDGFQVLENTNYKDFQTIFVTAYSQYSIKALRMNALDYIMKPIDPEDLCAAITKAKEQHKVKIYPQYQQLINSHKSGVFKKLGVPTSKGIRYVNLDDIIRFQAASNYTSIYIRDERPILISKTLKTFEKILDGGDFIRVHQSHLVNSKYISEYNRGDGSYLVLTNGDKITVSRANRTSISKIFRSF